MLIRDIRKVWIFENTPTNNQGEYENHWTYKGDGYFNIQQDVSELDRKSSGEIDYGIYKARATQDYSVKTGDGISLEDITFLSKITPEFRVIDITLIGSTYVIRMEKYNGD